MGAQTLVGLPMERHHEYAAESMIDWLQAVKAFYSQSQPKQMPDSMGRYKNQQNALLNRIF
jgi:hypothetical protein